LIVGNESAALDSHSIESLAMPQQRRLCAFRVMNLLLTPSPN